MMRVAHKQLIGLLCTLFVVAGLSQIGIPVQRATFSMDGLQLGMSHFEILEHWQLVPEAKSDGDILLFERDDDTSVMVYLRDSGVGSMVGESLTRDGASIKSGDTQASVRQLFGPATESINEPPL